MKRSLKRIATLAGAIAVAVAAAPPAPVMAEPGSACTPHAVVVSLQPEGLRTWRVWGELCLPHAGASTVQLLMAGSTANHLYWDFPFKPGRYSYVRALNAAGVATFNLDRLGTGNSDHPPSPLVTTQADVFIAHQVVTKLRHGDIGGHRFDRVVVVGHSHGAIVSLLEAASYHDVDGLVVAGLLHSPNGPNLAEAIATTIMPCAFDDRLATQCPDPGYVTYGPEMRTKWIHDPTADPRVVELDEATKDVTTLTSEASEGGYGVEALDAVLGSELRVPVLVGVGGHDLFMCGPEVGATDCSSAETVETAESPYYAGVPSLDVVVVPEAGHEINLEYHAQVWFKAAAAWAQVKVR